MPNLTRHVIGCMTGTSLDGLDAALVRITGEGLRVRAHFLRMTSRPLGDLADTLRSFAAASPHPPIDYLRAARRLGELHADACAELAAACGPAPVDFVVAHGQTIWHAPRDPAGHLSWQLFDPWPVARRLGVPVCYDLRQADLTAGGEGAPITPLADWVMYRHPDRGRVVCNLGGICNVTWIPSDAAPADVSGGDIGPCNLLLDGVVRELFPGKTYDEDGRIAASGKADGAVADRVFRHPFFSQRRASTGREAFSTEWVRSLVAELRPRHASEDIVAGAVEAVAQVVLRGTGPGETELVLAGGGARNKSLVARLHQTAAHVTTSDELGIPVEAREAMGFAVLGALSRDGLPITLPRVTGSKNPGRAGAWVEP